MDHNANEEVEYEDVYTSADETLEGDSGHTETGQAPASDTPSPAPATSDQLTSLLRQDSALRQQELEYRRQARERAEQEERERINAERQRQRQEELDQYVAGLLPAEQQSQLSEQQRQQYAQSQPFIREQANALLRQYAQERLAPSMRAQAERLARLEAQNEELRQRLENSPRPELDMDTRVSLLRPQITSFVSSPDFTAYLDETTDDGVPRRMVMQAAYQAGNVDSIIKMIDRYEERRGGRRQESPAPVSGVSSAPSTSRRPRMLRQSDYERAYQDYQLGKIDDKKMSEIEQKFELAYSEGRVDTTK